MISHSSFNMDGGGMMLIFILIAALVIAASIFSWIQARKRREALAGWALLKGLAFLEGRDDSYEDQFPDFKALKAGEGDRYAYNIISGDYRGRPLRAFDYHYITTSTDDKGHRTTNHHQFSAVIVNSLIPLKPLHIRPEGFFDHIAAAFGFEDINFESAAFSRQYKVTAPDRKWAYDVLHPRAIEFLLAVPPFSLQFDTGAVMFWNNKTWSVAEVEAAADTVNGLLDLLPDYLKEQQVGIPPPLPGGLS